MMSFFCTFVVSYVLYGLFQWLVIYHDRVGYRGFCLFVFRYGWVWSVPYEAVGMEYRQQGGLGADGGAGIPDDAGGVV